VTNVSHTLQAPQKIMWMAWDRYRRSGRSDKVKIDFYTGMPTMFSVKKYSDALDKLRIERGVGGHFQHNLTAIDVPNNKAIFTRPDQSTVHVDYTLLHVTPPMGPLDVLKGSPIADAAGWVEVNQETLQHVKPQFANVFALGDCSSLPTSKTAAAITAQAPVLTENLFSFLDGGRISKATYDGYTSCPVRQLFCQRYRPKVLISYYKVTHWVRAVDACGIQIRLGP
jgi:NADPH-dependent 2,4-dienoyl-CoA reductase/sulfur reductase-like enzyme